MAKVAVTGSYTDLHNTPTIPTVNNATLSLQANGTTKTTFYANDSTNRTFNIANGTSTTGNGTISVGGAAVSVYGLGTAAYVAANTLVSTSGTQTVGGSKTFTNNITVTTGPSDNYTSVTEDGFVARTTDDAFTSYEHNKIIVNNIDDEFEITLPSRGGTLALAENTSYSKLALTFAGGSSSGEWSEVIKTTAPIQVVKTSTDEQIDCKIVYSYTNNKLSGATITINGPTGSTAPTGYAALCIAGSSLA